MNWERVAPAVPKPSMLKKLRLFITVAFQVLKRIRSRSVDTFFDSRLVPPFLLLSSIHELDSLEQRDQGSDASQSRCEPPKSCITKAAVVSATTSAVVILPRSRRQISCSERASPAGSMTLLGKRHGICVRRRGGIEVHVVVAAASCRQRRLDQHLQRAAHGCICQSTFLASIVGSV